MSRPRLPIGERALAIARKHLVAPKEKNDFEFLATKPCWSGKRLRALLEHLQTLGGASSLRRAP